MSKQIKAHPQAARPWRRIAKKLLALLWLFMRSFFWTRRWFLRAKEKFPELDNDQEAFSKLNSFAIGAIFIIAYAFYGAQQLQTFGDVINNFFQSLTWASLANTAAFIILLYLIFAYCMRVRGKRFWQPLGYIFLPFSMWITLMLGAYFFFQHFGVDPNNLTTIGSLIWAAVLIAMVSSLLGFIYTVYRAVKARMNTERMHPVIAPLIELALSLKALIIASQGQALVLWLPYIPSRLLVLALPAFVVIFYAHYTIKIQRRYMRRRQTDINIELKRLWRQVSNTRRPAKNRLKDLWDFRKTQTFSFGVCILLLIIALFLPTGMMQAKIFPEQSVMQMLEGLSLAT